MLLSSKPLLLTAFLGLMLIRESICTLCSVLEILDKENDTGVYYVNEGMDTKLLCRVKHDFASKITVFWQKNNVTLRPAQHPRMRLSLYRYLKIKNVRHEEDAGFYTCVVENECGGKNAVHMQLFVNYGSTHNSNRNSTPAAPKFTVPRNKLARNLLAVPVGNSVKLDCSAEGYPRPTVRWYKDGTLFKQRKGGSLYLRPWTTVLVMKDVVPSDTGKYTCNVSNSHGWINHSYNVDVHERVRAKPVVLPIANVTAFVGENATLLCKALSDSWPHFQWLRWFPSHSNSSGNNSKIPNPPYTYEIIKQNEQQDSNQHLVFPKSNSKFDFHGVKLTLVNVTKKDEGKYTCIVGNDKGYAVQQAYILVKEEIAIQDDRSTSQNHRNNSMTTKIPPGDTPHNGRAEKPGSWTSKIRYPGALIGVSVAVIIVLITVSSWFCWKIKKTKASPRPQIASLQPRYEVQNEYVVVPDFR